MTKTDKIMSKIALPIIALAGMLLVTFIVLDARSTTHENSGHTRVINCGISVPATVRTQDDIEDCYKKVETELGIKLQRYDSSGYKE